jgi:hypothetical protein
MLNAQGTSFCKPHGNLSRCVDIEATSYESLCGNLAHYTTDDLGNFGDVHKVCRLSISYGSFYDRIANIGSAIKSG